MYLCPNCGSNRIHSTAPWTAFQRIRQRLNRKVMYRCATCGRVAWERERPRRTTETTLKPTHEDIWPPPDLRLLDDALTANSPKTRWATQMVPHVGEDSLSNPAIAGEKPAPDLHAIDDSMAKSRRNDRRPEPKRFAASDARSPKSESLAVEAPRASESELLPVGDTCSPGPAPNADSRN